MVHPPKIDIEPEVMMVWFRFDFPLPGGPYSQVNQPLLIFRGWYVGQMTWPGTKNVTVLYWVVVSHIFMFAPKFGEDSHFDEYFSTGLVQPQTRKRRHQTSPRLLGPEVKRPRAHRALSRANTAPIDVPWPP